MPPATLQRQSHYYAVFPHFGAFKESMTLNFAQRSFKVLHIGESQCMTSYRPLIVTVALSATVSEIVYCRFVLYAASHFFHTPLYNAGRDAELVWDFAWFDGGHERCCRRLSVFTVSEVGHGVSFMERAAPTSRLRQQVTGVVEPEVSRTLLASTGPSLALAVQHTYRNTWRNILTDSLLNYWLIRSSFNQLFTHSFIHLFILNSRPPCEQLTPLICSVIHFISSLWTRVGTWSKALTPDPTQHDPTYLLNFWSVEWVIEYLILVN